MSAKHTPGPWFVWEGDVYAGSPTVKQRGRLEGHRAQVCTVEDYEAPKTVARANARLIAAAPDLLEALEGIVREFDSMVILVSPVIQHLIESSRAAIAKAKGE